MQSQDPSEFTVESLWEDILSVLKRRKVFIAITTVCISILVYGVLMYLKDKYEASASLIVKLGTENVEVPVTVEKGGVYRQGVMKEEINTYVALLRSTPLLEKAMDRIGIERFKQEPKRPEGLLQRIKYEVKAVARFLKEQVNEGLILAGLRKRLTEREQLIIALSKWLTVSHEKDSNVINLNMRILDPVLGRDYLAAIIETYLVMHAEYVLGSGQELYALNEQIKKDGRYLELLREELMAYKKQNAIASVGEQRAGLTQLMKSLKEEIYQHERAMAGHISSRTHLLQRMQEVEEMVLANVVKVKGPQQQSILDKIAELQVERASLAVRYQEETPQLEGINHEILYLQNLVDAMAADSNREETFQRNPVMTEFERHLESVDLDMEMLSSKVSTARNQLADIYAELGVLDQAEIEIRRLELEINVAESRFLSNAESREVARSREVLRQSSVANVNVLVEPFYNAKPVFPRRVMYMGIGIIGALGISFGLALFMEWISDRIYDVKTLNQIPGIIVLGEYSLSNKAA